MKQAAQATFDFFEPMKALPVRDLPVGDWIYELKFDRYRALAAKQATLDGETAALDYRRRSSFGSSSIQREGKPNPVALSRSSHSKPDPSF